MQTTPLILNSGGLSLMVFEPYVLIRQDDSNTVLSGILVGVASGRQTGGEVFPDGTA